MPAIFDPPRELFDTIAWLLFFGGVALVVASWTGRIGKRLGWVGVWTTVTGGAMSWIEPPTVQVAVLAAGAIVIALQWLRRKPQPSRWKSKRGRPFTPWDQEGELLRLCHGDQASVERLIRYEIERNPNLSRSGAAMSAATRLRHEK